MDHNKLAKELNTEHTLLQTLAMYYIFNNLKKDGDRTQTAKVNFIAMLTDKNPTSIKRILANPLESRKSETVEKALLKLIDLFTALKISSIVEDIEKDLPTIKPDKKQ
jgi:hypothetical protein